MYLFGGASHRLDPAKWAIRAAAERWEQLDPATTFFVKVPSLLRASERRENSIHNTQLHVPRAVNQRMSG
jgi:hypothetical protein